MLCSAKCSACVMWQDQEQKQQQQRQRKITTVSNANVIVREIIIQRFILCVSVYLILPIIIIPKNLFWQNAHVARGKINDQNMKHVEHFKTTCWLKIWSTSECMFFLALCCKYITGQRVPLSFNQRNATMINKQTNENIHEYEKISSKKNKSKEFHPEEWMQKKKKKTFAFAPPIVVITFICLEKYFRRIIIIIKFSI